MPGGHFYSQSTLFPANPLHRNRGSRRSRTIRSPAQTPATPATTVPLYMALLEDEFGGDPELRAIGGRAPSLSERRTMSSSAPGKRSRFSDGVIATRSRPRLNRGRDRGVKEALSTVIGRAQVPTIANPLKSRNGISCPYNDSLWRHESLWSVVTRGGALPYPWV